MPRDDAIGIFWQDVPHKGKTMRAMPAVPETGWRTPTEFPNLAAAKALVVDTETFDPELDEHGPGWARHKGHIVGMSVSVPEGMSWYFPMRHESQTDDAPNMDPDHVLAWARDNLTRPEQPKIGANITYDIGWLREEGVIVQGPLHDVQFAEALLREQATVNLDDLGVRYGTGGKETDILYEFLDLWFGGPKTKLRQWIYKAPPRVVGPYAEGDVLQPPLILNKQWPLMAEQGLLNLYDMECRLIYLMVEMRFQGVRVDLDHFVQVREELVEDVKGIDAAIKGMVGFEVNPNATTDMLDAFTKLGLKPGITKLGKTCTGCDKCPHPSFAKPVLEAIDHPFVELIQKKRAREKLLGTFIDSYILNSHVNGRVHGQFHQLRSDDGGARSGRLSSSTPNLQNIPIRSKLGKRLRQGFVPDEGHLDWLKADYSQIEYRVLAHNAVGPGADDIRAKYRNDPTTDFHALVQRLIKEIAGRELERPLVKNVNFGTVYGMGEPGLARYINLPIKVAQELFAAIHKAAPFLKTTMEATMAEADRLGYITTILGRRSRFELWEPGYWDRSKARPPALPYDQAILRYPNIKRAYLHKSLNRRLQGSAADLIKMAMLIAWESGAFAKTGVPRLTVHDELDFSNPGGLDKEFKNIYRIMETAIPFSVPVQVGIEIGPSWGAVEDVKITL